MSNLKQSCNALDSFSVDGTVLGSIPFKRVACTLIFSEVKNVVIGLALVRTTMKTMTDKIKKTLLMETFIYVQLWR